MPSFPDALSMIQAVRAAYIDRPALVHLSGVALADVTPEVMEGEVAAPGCWVHDGSDIRGYVGPDALREDAIAALCPGGSPAAIALRSTESDGTVTVRAFDRDALLCLSVSRVTSRLQDWRWWSEAPGARVTALRQMLR
jgi:hypothetical protein